LLLFQTVDAIWQLLESGETDLLAIVHVLLQRVEEDILAILVHDLKYAALPYTYRCNSCPQVTCQKIRHATIGGKDIKHRSDGLALRDQFDSRIDHTLLEDLDCFSRHTAWNHTPYVIPMGNVRRPRHNLIAGKHRHGQNHVVQVGDATVVGVIGNEYIAWLDVTRLIKLTHDLLDGLIEYADKSGNAGA